MAQSNNLNSFRSKLPNLQKLKLWIILGSPIFLGLLFSAILQFTILANREAVTVWLASFGVFTVVIYAIIQAATIIIAPIGGNFIWMAMLSVFGPFPGLLIAYLVATPSYFVNFYLAKRYGRRIVRRLVGDEGIKRIDHLAVDAGVETAWVLKIFQTTYFDFVSYGLGLTKMSFKTFALINIVGGIPSTVIYYFILENTPNFVLGIFFVYTFSTILIALSFIWHHKRHKDRQKKLQKKK